MVDQIESVVWAISLLLNDCHVLSQCLLGILELGLESLDVLLVHHLVIRLLECHLSPQVLDLSVSIGLYARDLLLLSLVPDLIQITEQGGHECL